MGPIRCPETSVKDYHSTLRNIPKERKSYRQCDLLHICSEVKGDKLDGASCTLIRMKLVQYKENRLCLVEMQLCDTQINFLTIEKSENERRWATSKRRLAGCIPRTDLFR
jgi:hypothetical protein